MTVFDRFAADTAAIAAAAARLETLERRHQLLSAGFTRLERQTDLVHELRRSAAREIARMARLDRSIRRGEAMALRVVEALDSIVTDGLGNG